MRSFHCFQWVLAEAQRDSCYLLCQVGNEYITTTRWHKQKEGEEDIVTKTTEYLIWRPLKSAGSSGCGLMLKLWKRSTDSNLQTQALL